MNQKEYLDILNINLKKSEITIKTMFPDLYNDIIKENYQILIY